MQLLKLHNTTCLGSIAAMLAKAQDSISQIAWSPGWRQNGLAILPEPIICQNSETKSLVLLLAFVFVWRPMCDERKNEISFLRGVV